VAGAGATFGEREQAIAARPRATARTRRAIMSARYTDTATYATRAVDAFDTEL